VELDGVPDQVLEELEELPLVGHDRGQRIVGHLGLFLPYRHHEVLKRLFEDPVESRRLEGFPFRPHRE